VRAQYQALTEEHESSIATIKRLEAEIKERSEEKKAAKGSDQALGDLTSKLKAATDKLVTVTAEKAKLEGYLRTAKSIIKEEREKQKQFQDQELVKIQKQNEEVIAMLRNQIKDKDKEIGHFKVKFCRFYWSDLRSTATVVRQNLQYDLQ
jgi:hypothetical protein